MKEKKPAEFEPNITEKESTVSYFRQGAVDYAHFYTKGQGQHRGRHYRGLSCIIDAMLTRANPEYFFYLPNCTNFISQCLHCGGGIPMSDEWYHRNIQKKRCRFRQIPSGLLIPIQRFRILIHADRWEVSTVWRLAQAHFDYFSNPEHGFTVIPGIPFSKETDPSELIRQYPVQLGDLIYLVKGGKIGHSLLITKLTDREIYYSSNRYDRYDMPLSFALRNGKTESAYLVCLSDFISTGQLKPIHGDSI